MRLALIYGKILLVAFFTLARTSWAQDYDPFKIKREEFFGKCKTIALTPIRVPGILGNVDSVKAQFDSLLVAALRQADFVVIPSQEYEQIRQREMEQLGGFFDPITGKRDTAKTKFLTERCRRELHARFNADALFYASIQAVKVSFSGGKAKWHGASESLLSKGGIAGFFSDARYSSGTTGALSFFVALEDTNGADVYFNAGGIQVTHKISGTQLVPIPNEQFLTNKERNLAAVRLALGPLLKRAPFTEMQKREN